MCLVGLGSRFGRATSGQICTGLVLTLVAVSVASCFRWKIVPPVDYSIPASVVVPFGTPATVDRSHDFGALFSTTLAHMREAESEQKTRDPRGWAHCGDYLVGCQDVDPAPSLPPIPQDVQILLVPGIFGKCLEDLGVRVLNDAARHLAKAPHNLTLVIADVKGIGDSEENAEILATLVRRDPTARFIVVGYSKGAPDSLEMLRLYPDVRRQVVALVTVAGAVGGTRLADRPDAEAGQSLVKFLAQFPGDLNEKCGVGNGQGLASLKRGLRMRRLQEFVQLKLSIPAYSLVAISTPATTSKALTSGWNTLASYSMDEDSQVVAEESIVPGGTFLGRAVADHWAVALPFADTKQPFHDLALTFVDRNRPYPREALLEAIVQFVHADLRRGIASERIRP